MLEQGIKDLLHMFHYPRVHNGSVCKIRRTLASTKNRNLGAVVQGKHKVV